MTLKRFEPGLQLQRDAQLFYELWRGLPDGSQQLLYVSEQVSALVTVAAVNVTQVDANTGCLH